MIKRTVILVSLLLLACVSSCASVTGGNRRDKVSILLVNLKSEDKFVRYDAAEALGETRDERAVQPLIEALQTKDESLRFLAAEALGEIGSRHAVEALVSVLNEIGKREKDVLVIPFAQSTLSGPPKTLGWAVITALGRIGDRKAVEPLVNVLKDGQIYSVGEAAWALGEIGDTRAIQPLIDALKSKAELLPLSASEALKAITGQDFGTDYANWKQWYDETQKLIRQVISTGSWESIEALVGVGKLAVRPLTKLLKHTDPWVRCAAASGLAKTGDRKAVEALIVALRDSKPEVRCAVAEALGDIGDRKAVESLKERWEEETVSFVRPAVAYALYKIEESDDFLEFLLESVKDKQDFNRHYTAVLLGKLGNKQAAEALVEVTKEGSKRLSRHAGRALGGIKDKALTKRFVGTLIECLESESKYVRLSAAEALGLIGDERAVVPLVRLLRDKDEDVRNKVPWALSDIGKPSIVPLINVLKEDDIVARYHAATALMRITHEDFGFDYAAWKAWYEKNKDK